MKRGGYVLAGVIALLVAAFAAIAIEFVLILPVQGRTHGAMGTVIAVVKAATFIGVFMLVFREMREKFTGQE